MGFFDIFKFGKAREDKVDEMPKPSTAEILAAAKVQKYGYSAYNYTPPNLVPSLIPSIINFPNKIEIETEEVKPIKQPLHRSIDDEWETL